MDGSSIKFSPLSRNPEIQFQDVQIKFVELPQQLNTNVQLIGRIFATGILKDWAPTHMAFRAYKKQDNLILGQRCICLHLSDARAQEKGWERLWCMNCWSPVVIPFYHQYRHYEDHLIYHLPNCQSCNKRFIIWEHDVELQSSETYLYSEICNNRLQEKVLNLLEQFNTKQTTDHTVV